MLNNNSFSLSFLSLNIKLQGMSLVAQTPLTAFQISLAALKHIWKFKTSPRASYYVFVYHLFIGHFFHQSLTCCTLPTTTICSKTLCKSISFWVLTTNPVWIQIRFFVYIYGWMPACLPSSLNTGEKDKQKTKKPEMELVRYELPPLLHTPCMTCSRILPNGEIEKRSLIYVFRSVPSFLCLIDWYSGIPVYHLASSFFFLGALFRISLVCFGVI